MPEYVSICLNGTSICLNMAEYCWITLNMLENAWTNCSDYARILNMRVTRGGGGTSPLPFFENWKKLPQFGEKNALCTISHLKWNF